MFKKNKWETWYDELPAHTKIWLQNQPIWYDSDMWKAGLLGCLIGFLIGVLM